MQFWRNHIFQLNDTEGQQPDRYLIPGMDHQGYVSRPYIGVYEQYYLPLILTEVSPIWICNAKVVVEFGIMLDNTNSMPDRLSLQSNQSIARNRTNTLMNSISASTSLSIKSVANTRQKIELQSYDCNTTTTSRVRFYCPHLSSGQSG